MKKMQPTLPLEYTIRAAEAAIVHAVEVRETYRFNYDRMDRQRRREVSLAMDRLKRSMEPLRTKMGQNPYNWRELERKGDLPSLQKAQELRDEQAVLRELSDRMQKERRKLWKMQNKPKRKRKAKRTASKSRPTAPANRSEPESDS